MKTTLYEDTRHLSDADFESEIAAARALRRAHAETVAYERKLYGATFGISARYADASSESARERLRRAYLHAGLSGAQADAELRKL